MSRFTRANRFIICLRNCDEVKFLKQMHIPWYYLEYPHVSKLHRMLKNCKFVPKASSTQFTNPFVFLELFAMYQFQLEI
jgi:hypothetical protein